jgi:hypothetical protein
MANLAHRTQFISLCIQNSAIAVVICITTTTTAAAAVINNQSCNSYLPLGVMSYRLFSNHVPDRGSCARQGKTAHVHEIKTAPPPPPPPPENSQSTDVIIGSIGNFELVNSDSKYLLYLTKATRLAYSTSTSIIIIIIISSSSSNLSAKTFASVMFQGSEQ